MALTIHAPPEEAISQPGFEGRLPTPRKPQGPFQRPGQGPRDLVQPLSLGMTVCLSVPQFPHLLSVDWAYRKHSSNSGLESCSRASHQPEVCLPTQREERHLLSPRLPPEHPTTKGITVKAGNLQREQLSPFSLRLATAPPFHGARGTPSSLAKGF